MGTPYTGQLGGFGQTRLGHAPETGDTAQSLPGIIRHYRMDGSDSSLGLTDQCGHGSLRVYAGDHVDSTFTMGVDSPQGPAALVPHGSGEGAYGLGSDRYAELDTDDLTTEMAGGDGTISFWYSPLQTTSEEEDDHPTDFVLQQIVKFTSDDGGTFVFYQTGSGIQVASDGTTGSWGGNLSGPLLVGGTWYKVRASWSVDDGYTKVWVDDVLRLDTGYSPHVFAEDGVRFQIGQNFSSGDTWFNPPTGYTASRISFAGGIDDVAIYSDSHSDSGFDPSTIKYVSGSSSFAFYQAAVLTNPIRVTNMVAMALRDGGSVARVSQNFAEVVRSATPNSRITSMFVEVLAENPNPSFSVSATTGFTLTGTTVVSGVGHTYGVSASSGLGVSSIDTAFAGHPYAKSASSDIVFATTSTGYVPAILTKSASSSFVVNGNGTAEVHNPQPYLVSASTSFRLTPTASDYVARVIPISASTVFVLSGTSYSPTSFHVYADARIYLNHTGNRRLSYLFASATSGLAFAYQATKYRFGPVYVSASSSFALAPRATEHARLLINVSASSGMLFADVAPALKRGPILVSAGSSFRLRQALAYTRPGPRAVAATTNLSLTHAASYARTAILTVSAGTSFALSSAATETASLGVSARGDFGLTPAARQNRDISAAATTSLGVTIGPRTGNLKSVSATATFTITAFASLAKTGTLAGSDLVFTDLAQAVVWIPWRRTGLTLPAGGNLPHS